MKTENENDRLSALTNTSGDDEAPVAWQYEQIDWKFVKALCQAFSTRVGEGSYDQFMIPVQQRWLTGMKAALIDATAEVNPLVSDLTNPSGDDEAPVAYKIAAWMVRENERDHWDFVRLKKAADDLIKRGYEVVPLYSAAVARPQSAAVMDDAKDMHRRAQKAEGAVAAVRTVLDGWEGTLKHYGPQLPTHDLILTTIKRELEKAIGRAALLETKEG